MNILRLRIESTTSRVNGHTLCPCATTGLLVFVLIIFLWQKICILHHSFLKYITFIIFNKIDLTDICQINLLSCQNDYKLCQSVGSSLNAMVIHGQAKTMVFTSYIVNSNSHRPCLQWYVRNCNVLWIKPN